MNVFLSIGNPDSYNDKQRQFAVALDAFLVNKGCKKHTVTDERSDQPIAAARELMESVDAIVVVAFTRLIVHQTTENPGSLEEIRLDTDRRYPTIWNQLEAAMGFGLKLPLLVIIEEGLQQEAMLKDRLEFRVVSSNLDPKLFESKSFGKKFDHWAQRVKEKPKKRIHNLSDMTIVELLSQLRLDQIWKVGSALIAFIGVVATAAFWIGKNIQIIG